MRNGARAVVGLRGKQNNRVRQGNGRAEKFVGGTIEFLCGDGRICSVEIEGDLRSTFYLDGDTVVSLIIGTHDIYQG